MHMRHQEMAQPFALQSGPAQIVDAGTEHRSHTLDTGTVT